jgi:hypothetical protein
MLGKSMVALIGLALCAPTAEAAEHRDGPHHPALMIPLPGDFTPPPPPEDEEARRGWFEEAFSALDADGDGVISKEELMAAMRKPHHRPGDGGPHGGGPHGGGPHGGGPHGDGPHGDGPHGDGGEFEGLSADDEELSGLPEPPPCDEDLRDSELTPQEVDVACGSSESVGNLIFRTVCNMDPYRSEAISLPSGRAADCFAIEAIRGSGITFEIVDESTGTAIFNTADGKHAFDTLVLTGDPSGTNVYRINLLSGDTPDASLTIRFIDHPTF